MGNCAEALKVVASRLENKTAKIYLLNVACTLILFLSKAMQLGG